MWLEQTSSWNVMRCVQRLGYLTCSFLAACWKNNRGLQNRLWIDFVSTRGSNIELCVLNIGFNQYFTRFRQILLQGWVRDRILCTGSESTLPWVLHGFTTLLWWFVLHIIWWGSLLWFVFNSDRRMRWAVVETLTHESCSSFPFTSKWFHCMRVNARSCWQLQFLMFRCTDSAEQLILASLGAGFL